LAAASQEAGMVTSGARKSTVARAVNAPAGIDLVDIYWRIYEEIACEDGQDAAKKPSQRFK
jgi:hypothetical protein